MLQAMRSGTKSPIMKAFLLFLAGGFALWGIGDVSNGLFGGGDKAVKAGSQSVSIYEAANEFELIRRSSQSNLGVGQALQAGLLEDVMGQLSRKTVFAAEADALQIDVTRDMLRQAVANEPAFQNELGEFSEGRFLQLLAQNGFNEEAYLLRLRDALITEQFVASVAAGGSYPTGLARALGEFQLEKRTASILRFDVREDAVASPDASVLQSWYDENEETYDAPALRDVEVLNLSATKIASSISLSEDEIKLAYETRLDEFNTPELRSVRQMVFTNQEDADAAVAQIEDVAQFNDVASELLNWTENDVNLGEVSKGDLDLALGDAVFEAAIGELVGPVQTAFGYNVAIVDTITEGGQKTLDDVRANVEDRLRTEQSFKQLFDMVNAVEDTLGGGATLAEAAASINIELDLVSGISQNGQNIDGTSYTGAGSEIASDSAFLTEAWALDIDETSVIIEASIDNYFIVRPVAETNPRGRQLAEVMERATNDWKREQAIEASRKDAEAAMEAGDASFVDAAATAEFQRNGVGLDDEAAGLIARAAFAQDSEEASLVETGTETLVVKTLSIQQADAAGVTDFIDNLASTFDQLVKDDIGTALAIHLSDEHDLQTYPEPVRQILVSQGN